MEKQRTQEEVEEIMNEIKKKKVKISIFFAWYDIWIGAYWNDLAKVLYICPIPMICIRIDMYWWFYVMGEVKEKTEYEE